MASRPALVAENDAASTSRRSKTAAKPAARKTSAVHGQTCATTIHWDVAAIVRWAFFGAATLLIAIAILIIAIRGDENYPTTTAIKAIGSTGQSVDAPQKPKR